MLATSLLAAVTFPAKRQQIPRRSPDRVSSTAAVNSLPTEEKLNCANSVNTPSAANTTEATSVAAWDVSTWGVELITAITSKSEKNKIKANNLEAYSRLRFTEIQINF